jgi:uncharacterized membrane-anchored protein YhcB (DUF1043 family)
MVLFFITGIGMSKIYKSEMRILLLPRSEVTARNIDQVLRNAEEIPLSLSFYNKMLELNTDIEDNLATLSDSQRKAAWDRIVKIDTVRKSGIIKINVYNKNQLQTEIISRQATSSLVTVLSKYYDIKTDLDMRIIDGPIVSIVSKISFWTLFLLSLILGILIGSVVYFMVKFFPKKESLFKSESLKKYLQPAFQGKAKTLSGYFSSSKEEAENLDEMKAFEEAYSFEKKGSAPDNLPIADEKGDGLAVLQKSSENVSQIITREATTNEVKARLNKLLNG